jgi:hypothetical protein
MNSGYRKKKSTIDDAPNDGDSTWIWGNHRGGGGGEPVKDQFGNSMANLKNVVGGGKQEPPSRRDYSPPYNEPARSQQNKNIRRMKNDDDDDDPYSNHNRQNFRRGGGGGVGAADRNERRIPGLNDFEPSGGGDGSPSNNGSPKKFMSALQEMNTSATYQERQAKIKYEKNFNFQLNYIIYVYFY